MKAPVLNIFLKIFYSTFQHLLSFTYSSILFFYYIFSVFYSDLLFFCTLNMASPRVACTPLLWYKKESCYTALRSCVPLWSLPVWPDPAHCSVLLTTGFLVTFSSTGEQFCRFFLINIFLHFADGSPARGRRSGSGSWFFWVLLRVFRWRRSRLPPPAGTVFNDLLLPTVDPAVGR